jgi:glycosyltransferase involved in cell wall biosynthesis
VNEFFGGTTEKRVQACSPLRILWVFGWLAVGGEETELQLLARHLDPTRFRIDVVACSHRDGMPDRTLRQLHALGLDVDTTPYALPFPEKVTYLAGKMAAYDVVVASHAAGEVVPALERLALPPPLVEHGGLVAEAGGPKHLTTRYVGVSRTIRDEAARRMPGREEHALEIPPMVDLSAFDPADRGAVRAELGVADDRLLIGWVGRLDPTKRVEDFVDAAALLTSRRPDAQFVIIGGPDAFQPDYEAALRARAAPLGDHLRFLGDRPDVPRLLAGLDSLVWLSRDEGMPHVIAEAGAARLPVVATADNGSLQQICDGILGLLVPHRDPAAVAAALSRLCGNPALRTRLGTALRAHVEREHAVDAVLPRWESLLAEVAAETPAPAPHRTLLPSMFGGGFECSTHRRAHDRARVDVIASSRHDRHAREDHALLAAHDLRWAREGLRWHLIETQPGRYDWSSLQAQIDAAAAAGTTVFWDLLHCGWPDFLDIWSPDFPARFADFAHAAAAHLAPQVPTPLLATPVNEISYMAWAGGTVGRMNPFGIERGVELRDQLVAVAIAGSEAVRAVDPAARLLWAEPVINVVPATPDPADADAARTWRSSEFGAFDRLAALRPDLVDLVGVNYYWANQWTMTSAGERHTIDWSKPDYTPFAKLLREVHRRYGRPLLVSETGIEGERRPVWLAYVTDEVAAARAIGVPVEGICLYPVMDHPGWDDERYCPNGLIETHGEGRTVYAPLAEELARQQGRFAASHAQSKTP